MHWYVRYEGTEEISGPMSKEDALSTANETGGIVFSGAIYGDLREKTSEIPPNMDNLLTDLRDMAMSREYPHCQKLIQRAIDALVNLSKPKYIMSGEVGCLIAELQGLREAKEIIRQGENDAIGKMLKCVIDALVELSREKVINGCTADVYNVTGEIHGGILTLDNVPEGVSVTIRNYWVTGKEEKLEEDAHGKYHVLTWGRTE